MKMKMKIQSMQSLKKEMQSVARGCLTDSVLPTAIKNFS